MYVTLWYFIIWWYFINTLVSSILGTSVMTSTQCLAPRSVYLLHLRSYTTGSEWLQLFFFVHFCCPVPNVFSKRDLGDQMNSKLLCKCKRNVKGKGVWVPLIFLKLFPREEVIKLQFLLSSSATNSLWWLGKGATEWTGHTDSFVTLSTQSIQRFPKQSLSYLDSDQRYSLHEQWTSLVTRTSNEALHCLRLEHLVKEGRSFL